LNTRVDIDPRYKAPVKKKRPKPKIELDGIPTSSFNRLNFNKRTKANPNGARRKPMVNLLSGKESFQKTVVTVAVIQIGKRY